MKKRISITIIFCLLLVNFLPAAFATEKDLTNNDIKIVYISKNKSKVLEAKYGSNTTYIVVADLIKINDLSDKKKIKEITDKDKEAKILGNRTYFTFVENLDEAKKMADNAPTPDSNTSGEVSTESIKYFWHYSYIEDYYSGGILNYHTHLSPTDVAYVQNVGIAIADTLSAVLVATGIVTGPVGVVLGGIVTIAILSYFQYATNPDGSLDINAKRTDLNINDTTVESGERLGLAQAGTGYWRTYYWPSNAPDYSL
ncbi:hypothetical protein [Desulfoscipio geothermicus]|uniref:Uncharacterized protein n=1 Tax=Desulfoscipio geothermicus DSM 3669 TaxID=1121426 RepID=A0A1I6DWH0_9FIRM|nr:hypothetical protein [Desulfoscipio geothermicus]SFR09717.1 hypothetical protein SAMN05660706_11938 [Desulfoscipio geothermicus DSM 3669]